MAPGTPVVPERFARQAFLEGGADESAALARALATWFTDELRRATHPGTREIEIIEDLQKLGHPIDLFDQQGAGGVFGSKWCEWGAKAQDAVGSLVIETVYPQAATVDGAEVAPAHDLPAQVTVTFNPVR